MANTLPTDKNVYTINDTVIRQIDCQASFGEKNATFTIKLAGDTNAVTDTASNFRAGKRVTLADIKSKFNELSGLAASDFQTSGKVTSSTSTTKQGSAQATIVIQIPYKNKPNASGSGGDEDPEYSKVVTWAEKSTQYEFPLGIYAGESQSASQCNAGNFEAWKNERTRNIENYKNFQYELSGDTIPLEGHTLDLAKKWYKGVEAVDRAYPEVTRTSNYYNVKTSSSVSAGGGAIISEIEEDPELYYTDTTPDSVWSSKFPDHSWLKSAYDVDIQATEYDNFWNVTVTEAWIGIPIEERGVWDPDLYGANRWSFADVAG